MSQLVFPTLAGFDIAVKRTPVFSTVVQAAASGKELRASLQSQPRWRYEIPLNFLRIPGFSANTSTNEMAAILGLLNTVRGAWDNFLYTDPYSNTAALTPFGTGNASTTAFQLLDIEGFPIYDMNGTPVVYRTDWRGKQMLYTTPRTNLILYSEQLDNAAWTKQTGVTVTVNATTAPDGTVTADQINWSTAATATGILKSGIAVNPTIKNTKSIYVRADVAGGSISITDPNSTVNTIIILLTTAWQQISLSEIQSGGLAGLWIKKNADSPTSIYLWGAQLESATSSLTSYIPTTSAAVTVTDYTLSGTGLVTMAVAPVNAATLTWTGSYYRRVRFDMDEYEQTQMFNLCWESVAIKLISVK